MQDSRTDRQARTFERKASREAHYKRGTEKRQTSKGQVRNQLMRSY